MKLLRILLISPIILFSREQLGVLNFEAINVNPIEARALTNALSTEINLISDYKIIKQSEINRRFFDKHIDAAEFAKRKNDEGYHATVKTDGAGHG